MNEREIFLQEALILLWLHLSYLQIFWYRPWEIQIVFLIRKKSLNLVSKWFRSSHSQMCRKIGVLNFFFKVHWKRSALESFFNKVVVLKALNLIKKRLQHMHFPANFAKLLRMTFLQNTSGRLLLVISHSNKGFIQRFFVCSLIFFCYL